MMTLLGTLVLIMALSVVPAVATPNMLVPGPKNISFTVASRTYTVNGLSKTMDVTPFISPSTGRTYVPALYLAEALGASVSWNQNTGKVFLSYEDNLSVVALWSFILPMMEAPTGTLPSLSAKEGTGLFGVLLMVDKE